MRNWGIPGGWWRWGIDGSGKSTQIYLLKRWQVTGVGCVEAVEPSGFVKKATRRGKQQKTAPPTTFSLIPLNFADRYERQLVPRFKAWYIVLCDRYKFTAFARDTVRGCSPEWVRKIWLLALPDLTFFFGHHLRCR